MVSESMVAKLNEQITAELSAAHQYLAMACALDEMGLKILGRRFVEQADEERVHAMKILHYLQEVGGTVRLDAVPRPRADFKNVAAIVQAGLESEELITQQINDLVALADSENDYATRSFLQWFVDEQVEEVAGMRDLLALVKMAGDNLLQVEARVRHEMMAKGS